MVYLTRKMLFMADSYSYVDRFDQDCKKALNVIRENGGTCMHSTLARAVRRPADYLKKLVATLIGREAIIETTVAKEDGVGRPGKYYRLL